MLSRSRIPAEFAPEGVRGCVRLHGALTSAFVGAALLALGAVLLAPRAALPEAFVRSVVVDVSASATRCSPGYVGTVRAVLEREARSARSAAEDLLVVLVASDVRVAFGPAHPAGFLERLAGVSGAPFDPLAATGGGGQRLASELARGVQFVEQALRDRGVTKGSLLIVGDGSFTGSNPELDIARLTFADVNWRGVSLVPPERCDGSLRELRLPRWVEPGAPLGGSARIEVRVGSAEPLPALTLEVTASSVSGTQQRRYPVPLQVHPAVVGQVVVAHAEVSFSLGPATSGTRVVARLVSEGRPDPIPENDRREGFVAVGDARVLGVVAGEGRREDAERFFDRAPAGLLPLFLSPEELPARIAELDALAVFDVALERLPEALCRSFVEHGGGLLVAGGWQLLGTWPEEAEPDELAALLPLGPDPGEDRARDVIVLVDGSGSMAGDPFEQVARASQALVRAAPRSDRVVLRFFTGILQPELLLRAAGVGPDASDALARVFQTRVPGGATRILTALEQLASERERSVDRALVLLLSDGREADDVIRVEQRSREVATRLRAAGAELVVFGVGERTDLEFLRGLASDRELRTTGDLGQLSELFQREVNRERVLAADAIGVEIAARGATSLAAAIVPAGLEPAPLQRVLRTRPRAGAEVALSASSGEPVLACARAGLGRTAVFASLPWSDWGASWTSHLENLTPTLRWLARGPQADRPRIEIEAGRVVLRNAPDSLPPLVEARFRVGASAGGTAPGIGETVGTPLRLGLSAAASGVSLEDVREAVVPDWLAGRRAGVLIVDIVGAAGEAVLSLPLSVAGMPEFREPRPRLTLAAAPAHSEGSRRPPLGAGGEAHSAAAGVLGVGLILIFLAGLLVRWSPRSLRE